MEKIQAGKEEIVFSAIYFEKNNFGMKQERILVLTPLKMYNVKRLNVKRSEVLKMIPLDKIEGLTKCTDLMRNKSYVVHLFKDTDYLVESDTLDEIFSQIKYYYWMITQKNLPIYAVSGNVEDMIKKKARPGDNDRAFEDIYPEAGQSPAPFAPKASPAPVAVVKKVVEPPEPKIVPKPVLKEDDPPA